MCLCTKVLASSVTEPDVILEADNPRLEGTTVGFESSFTVFHIDWLHSYLGQSECLSLY